jgi:small-conductance mechanosensitive channel
MSSRQREYKQHYNDSKLTDKYEKYMSDSDDEDAEEIFNNLAPDQASDSESTVRKGSGVFSVQRVTVLVSIFILLGTLPWLISLTRSGGAFGSSKGTLFRICLIVNITSGSLLLSRLLVAFTIRLVHSSPTLATKFLYYLVPLEVQISFLMASCMFFISLLAFQTITINGNNLDSFSNDFIDHYTLVLVTFTVASFLLTLFTFMVWRFGIGFMRSAFHSRIMQNLLSEYVILSVLHRITQTSVVTVDDKEPSHQSNGQSLDSFPITEAQLLTGQVSDGKLAQLLEYIKLHPDLSLTRYFQESSRRRKSLYSSESKKQKIDKLKALSKLMFEKLKDPRSACINPNSIRNYVSGEVADKVMESWDKNLDRSLSEKEFYRAVVETLVGRKSLGLSIVDAERSLEKLASIARVFALILSGFAASVIFGKDTTKILATTSTFLVAAAVGIGDTLKALLSSIVFLFVTHPFDIGDRVMIDNKVFLVHKIRIMRFVVSFNSLYIVIDNVFSTVLRRHDNAQVYFPNSELAKKNIINLRRSTPQFDILEINVSFTTTITQLNAFENALSTFLADQTQDFHSNFEVFYKSCEDGNKLCMNVWIQHRDNFHNMKRFRERRSLALLNIKRMLEALEIEYSLPITKIHVTGDAKSLFPMGK